MARSGLFATLLVVCASCGGAGSKAGLPATVDDDAARPAPSACGERGFLSTDLYGAITAPIHWTTADLDCRGMPRPDGQGARLHFAGNAGEHRLAFIIAMPELQRGAKGEELSSNVTLIAEGGGRFFSTASLGICWTDITSLEELDEARDRYAIGGTVYCVTPLAEVNGDSSVSLAELEFLGLLDWNAS